MGKINLLVTRRHMLLSHSIVCMIRNSSTKMLVIPAKIFGPSLKAEQLLKRTYACWLHYIIYGKKREVMTRFILAVHSCRLYRNKLSGDSPEVFDSELDRAANLISYFSKALKAIIESCTLSTAQSPVFPCRVINAFKTRIGSQNEDFGNNSIQEHWAFMHSIRYCKSRQICALSMMLEYGTSQFVVVSFPDNSDPSVTLTTDESSRNDLDLASVLFISSIKTFVSSFSHKLRKRRALKSLQNRVLSVISDIVPSTQRFLSGV